jgi:hypothetical protein
MLSAQPSCSAISACKFAAGEKAGRRLPNLGSVADGLVISMGHTTAPRPLYLYRSKRNPYRRLPASSIVVGLTIALPQGRADLADVQASRSQAATASISASTLK